MILELFEDSILLRTKITPIVLTVVGQLEGRRSWLKAGGLKAEKTAFNIELLSNLPGAIIKNSCEIEQKNFIERKAKNYTPKTEPYDHQQRARTKIGDQPIIGLFMEQGTGKTKVLIDWGSELFASCLITGILVVSKKGAHSQWIDSELPKHCGIDFAGVPWPVNEYPEEFIGPKNDLEVFSFNWDGIKTARGLPIAEQFCKRHNKNLLIIADESQEMKNHRTGRHKALMKLRRYSSHRALATGTPIAKDLCDEWAQLLWLDENIIGIRYATTFKAQYCIMGGFEGRSVIGHKNIDRFKRITDPYIFRATKEEIGILPKQYTHWKFDITKRQFDLARELKLNFKATLDSGEEATIANAVSFMTKFQQIGSGFVILNDKSVERLMPVDKNPRALAMIDWLGTFEGKALIWARFKEDMKIITELLEMKGESFVQYHGSIKDKDRKLAIESFLSTQGARILVANPQSAGTGLNLQGLCNNALYYTNSFNAIDRWQSEDRIHRIGTVGGVTYTDLIAKKTGDPHIANNLKKKKGLSDLVLSSINDLLSINDE